MQKIRTIIKTPYEISDPEALWIDTSNADSPTLKVHEQGTWKSLGTSDGGSATPDNGILTVDGRHWAMADKDGSGPYTKAEAMQRLGWTEEQFDAVLSEPSPNELPKPCAVFYYGYFFPKYVTVYGTFAGVSVLIPHRLNDGEATPEFEELRIIIKGGTPNNPTYTIYGHFKGSLPQQ